MNSTPVPNLLPKDGDVFYYGAILSSENSDRYLSILLDTIPWKPDEAIIMGKHIYTKRHVAWHADMPFEYTYSRITKQALPWTKELLALKSTIENICGESFNSCLLNLYHDGSEGMTWHSDAEKDLAKNGAIASLSFGAERKFSFKHKKEKTHCSLILQHGSLLVMRGTTQTNWFHRLPPTKTIKMPRVNLNQLVEQIFQVAKEKKLKYFGLIGHSFGTYLALRFIENYSKFVKGLLMISPMPLLYSQWRQSIQNVINKITPSDNSLITKYTIENNGSEVLKLLLPYYIVNANTMLPTVNFNMEVCNRLEAQVPEYNDIEMLRGLTIPFYCICGNQDPFYHADTIPMTNIKILTNIGHYPFYEDIGLFKTSLIEAEKALGFGILA